jgi:hypothetical protein
MVGLMEAEREASERILVKERVEGAWEKVEGAWKAVFRYFLRCELKEPPLR